MANGQVVTMADLQKLQEQENRPTPLTEDELRDYATATLMVLRGLPLREKRKVIARMTKQLR